MMFYTKRIDGVVRVFKRPVPDVSHPAAYKLSD